ncbi:adenylate/guanylate cyclase domain-containing protein [Sphingobacterium siyangense]|uniref:Adenylate cyclase n=1 Tax=Sphingobacterium siyangense TaxID=459529 RepID=A0A562MFU1_9SPHI|nr:adenylate/guanylate cyclase domain-containing protein [Sphingobacterium siyangense]TWI18807.1 adenylate cyclase [Sphingobacterium siyangense]
MKGKLMFNHIKEVVYVAVVWILITAFFLFIKFNDLPDGCLYEMYAVPEALTKTSRHQYQITFFIVVPLGIIFGILHTFVYPAFRRKKPLVVALLRLLIFATLTTLVYYIALFFSGQDAMMHSKSLFDVFRRNTTETIIIYMLSTEYIAGLVILLRRSLGGNYLYHIVKNTYNNPKEEERVFMFLDMENSTPSAQQLGHLNFSKYVQDCFWDLSDIVLKYNGEIYQYVGDEAVITWKVANNFKFKQCIDLYFAYKDLLKHRESFYQKRYGIQPAFKCAIHSGKVSAVMVGNYKREIAYHGNVLNLCARLQAACKENEADMLLSENFYNHIKNQSEYTIDTVELLNLRGIEGLQMAYKVFKSKNTQEC